MKNYKMPIAGRKLCEQLYELTGWKNARLKLYKGGWVLTGSPEGYDNIPAYDAGYLLRNLPDSNQGGLLYVSRTPIGRWSAGFKGGTSRNADTPEDALCKLAIELIKSGVIDEKRKAIKGESNG